MPRRNAGGAGADAGRLGVRRAIFAGYTVVVETVFAWPGLGRLALQAIQRQDLFLVQAVVLSSR